MTTYVIKFDKDGCTGCGMCQSECPDNWEMQDGVAAFKKGEFDDSELECNKRAADSCPVSVITIEEKQ